jgi:putative flippase GtrA
VGGLSTLVDFSILALLKDFGQPIALANSLSYSAGIAINFTLNRLWTYPDSPAKRAALQFVQFVIVSLCGLLLNTGIVLVMMSVLGRLLNIPTGSYLPAKVIATAAVFAWNFMINRLWSFNGVG